jgi:TusA-related sulfurtransferase
LASARRRKGDSDLRRQIRGSLDDDTLRELVPDQEVDALGTFCPEPVIRTQDQMATMSNGEVLLLLADDMGVEVDIPAWCLSTGNEYLGVLKEDVVYRVFVRRASKSSPDQPYR